MIVYTAAMGRPEYHPWYGLATWKRLRQQHRKRNPLCVQCKKEGRTTAMAHVDHIDDHKGDWQKFIDPANLQSLCVECHNRKTGLKGNPQGGCDVDGNPLDPAAHWR